MGDAEPANAVPQSAYYPQSRVISEPTASLDQHLWELARASPTMNQSRRELGHWDYVLMGQGTTSCGGYTALITTCNGCPTNQNEINECNNAVYSLAAANGRSPGRGVQVQNDW